MEYAGSPQEGEVLRGKGTVMGPQGGQGLGKDGGRRQRRKRRKKKGGVMGLDIWGFGRKGWEDG